MDIQKDYIGDGVYVKEGNYIGEIIIYTFDGITELNHIYFEPEMVDTLKRVADRFIKLRTEATKNKSL